MVCGMKEEQGLAREDILGLADGVELQSRWRKKKVSKPKMEKEERGGKAAILVNACTRAARHPYIDCLP
jgi:hypothetical protein